MAPLKQFVERDADFVPDAYVAPGGVERMHAYPRWGWPNQPVYLDSSSGQEEKQDYLTGIIVGSLIIFMVFIVWALVLLGLKCAGKRVGCASGMPRKPKRPDPSIMAAASGKHHLDEEQEQAMAEVDAAARSGSAFPQNSSRHSASGHGSARGSSRSDRRASSRKIPSGVQRWLRSMEEDGRRKEAEAVMDGSTRSFNDSNSHGGFQVATEPVPECVEEWLDEQERIQRAEAEALDEAEQESAIMSAAMSGGVNAAAARSMRISQSPSDFPSMTDRMAQDPARREYEMEMERWRTAVRKHERRINVVRVVFLLCGVTLITAAALFYSKGLMSLKNSLESAQGTISYGEEVLSSAHNLTVFYLDSQEAARDEADNLRYSADEFCPQISGALNLTALNLTANETAAIEAKIAAVKDALGSIAIDGLEEEVSGMERDLVEAMDAAAYANDALDKAYPFLYAGAAVMGVQIIITMALMAEVVLAWRGRKMRGCFVSCMKNAVILPIFFFFLVLGWLFASLFLLAAISGADFCARPDDNVRTLLNSGVESGTFGSSLVDYFAYFVGCNADSKPVEIPEEANLVFAALGVIHDFTQYLASDSSVAGKVCGSAGENLLSKLAGIVHDELHVINDILIGLLDILQCSTFNPLYTSAMYDAFCIHGVDGLAWMFGTQLCIAVCSMIMITVRAARQQDDEDDAEYYPYPEGSTKQLAVEPAAAADGDDVVEESPDPQVAAAAAVAAGTGAAGAAYVLSGEDEEEDSNDEEQERGTSLSAPVEESPGPPVAAAAAVGAAAAGVAGAAYVLSGEDDSNDSEEQQRDSMTSRSENASLDVEALEDDSVVASEEEEANLAALATLTPDQQDAIEAIGVRQDEDGTILSEEDCIDALGEVRPELSEEQINAVIALGLLTTSNQDHQESNPEGHASDDERTWEGPDEESNGDVSLCIEALEDDSTVAVALAEGEDAKEDQEEENSPGSNAADEERAWEAQDNREGNADHEGKASEAEHEENKPEIEEGDHEVNMAVLETLTGDQREYIEEIGIAQERGGLMSEEEISDALHHGPGLSDEQIEAVIALELSTRAGQS